MENLLPQSSTRGENEKRGSEPGDYNQVLVRGMVLGWAQATTKSAFV